MRHSSCASLNNVMDSDCCRLRQNTACSPLRVVEPGPQPLAQSRGQSGGLGQVPGISIVTVLERVQQPVARAHPSAREITRIASSQRE